MKKLILTTERLNDLSTELIGNGGESRLDIMLDLETGEVWADEFYDHEANSWLRYEDENIICVGQARNSKLEDDWEEVEGCEWSIRIYAPDGNSADDIYLVGDYYNNYYDVDDVLDAIIQLYDKQLYDDELE